MITNYHDHDHDHDHDHRHHRLYDLFVTIGACKLVHDTANNKLCKMAMRIIVMDDNDGDGDDDDGDGDGDDDDDYDRDHDDDRFMKRRCVIADNKCERRYVMAHQTRYEKGDV